MKTQTTVSMVEKVSAVTLRVANMEASVRFYKDVLGLEMIYGGEGSYFTSLRTKDGDTILNLEHGNASIQWGRLIFHVSDVDRFWAYLMEILVCNLFYHSTHIFAAWQQRLSTVGAVAGNGFKHRPRCMSRTGSKNLGRSS